MRQPCVLIRTLLSGQCMGIRWNCAVQALCTEASLHALRRRYPQIYDSDEKLLIDPRTIAVEQQDYEAALTSITPASHRSAAAHTRWEVLSPLMPCPAPSRSPPRSSTLMFCLPLRLCVRSHQCEGCRSCAVSCKLSRPGATLWLACC